MPTANPNDGLAAPFDNAEPSPRSTATSAPFNNSAPGIAPVATRLSAIVRATSNLPWSAQLQVTSTAGTIDGVKIGGTEATRQDRLVLLTAQTNPAQNGLFVAGTTGADVGLNNGMSSPVFDGSGQWIKTGLTAGRLYYWQKGTFEASVTNGADTLTASGFIAASGSGELTFTGTATQTLNGSLRDANLVRADIFNDSSEIIEDTVVMVTGGTNSPTWWRLTAAVPTLGTNPVTWQQITT